MQRKSKIALASVTVAIASVLTVIIGPFTFYASVVPFLGPVLSRPDGVPKTADASYSWKGFGLFWRWEREFRNGCISWGATENPDYFDVRLVSGPASCDAVGLSLQYRSYSDEIVFARSGNWLGGEPCPFKVSEEQIAAYKQLIDAARKTANEHIEQPALSKIELRLNKVDGQSLTTEYRRGCNDLKPSDYGKPDLAPRAPNVTTQ
jgi:hypothetical protein